MWTCRSILLHPRRSGPHARYGILGRHHADCQISSEGAADHHVLCHYAYQNPATGQDHSSRPGGSETGRIQAGGKNHSGRLHLLRGTETGYHPVAVPVPATGACYHLCLFQTEGERGDQGPETHEAECGRNALRPGAEPA